MPQESGGVQMNKLPCPYCGFNCEIHSNTEEQIECPRCRSIFLFIQNSESHGTIDYDVCCKSEADKVIKELKATAAQLEDDVAYWKMKYLGLKNEDVI